jgi:hypothetical protein
MTLASNPEDILEAVRERAGIAETMWLLGWQRSSENQSPPLYVWYADTIDDRPGESAGGDEPAAATCVLGFIVKIWGVSLYDCFSRYVLLRTALYLEAETSVTIARGRWARPGTITLGMGLEVPVAFHVPVPADLVDVDTVQAEEAVLTTTGAVSGDSWLELGD